MPWLFRGGANVVRVRNVRGRNAASRDVRRRDKVTFPKIRVIILNTNIRNMQWHP